MLNFASTATVAISSIMLPKYLVLYCLTYSISSFILWAARWVCLRAECWTATTAPHQITNCIPLRRQRTSMESIVTLLLANPSVIVLKEASKSEISFHQREGRGKRELLFKEPSSPFTSRALSSSKKEEPETNAQHSCTYQHSSPYLRQRCLHRARCIKFFDESHSTFHN